jgi:hypothetical protein
MTTDSQDSPRPKLGGSHHLPPYNILCTSPRGLHPNGFLSRDSQRGIPKLPKLDLSQLYGAITSCSDLRLGWVLKKSCSANDVLHATCTHWSQIDSWHFVVRNQIANLTPDLSFCHNLCYRCLNGSCEPILDIYTSIAFQWYRELFNARCFDLCNFSLKVWESIETPTPKMGTHLGVWLVILTLSHTPLGPRPYKLLP